MADDLTLVVGGQRYLTGWTDIRVTRGIERVPCDFDIGMTELAPSESQALTVQPGDSVQVLIGQDVVVTGFVNEFTPSIEPEGHSIRVAGRGKCQDLVDCSAEWPGGQISGNNVLQIAQKLAAPYGINVVESQGAEVGKPIPKFNLIVTDTPYDIIERICRYRGLLCFEGADGSFILSAVGTTYAGSGFSEGVNVQRASMRYSDMGRYSQYDVFLQGMDTLQDTGTGGNLLASMQDAAVKRHRLLSMVAEAAGGDAGLDVSKQRMVWEYARRIGRSYELQLTTDSWRDQNGALWQPNTLVPLSLPSLKISPQNASLVTSSGGQCWLISQVTYRRNSESGTTADLVIMPQMAFLPEPIVFQPLAADVAQSIQSYQAGQGLPAPN